MQSCACPVKASHGVPIAHPPWLWPSRRASSNRASSLAFAASGVPARAFTGWRRTTFLRLSTVLRLNRLLLADRGRLVTHGSATRLRPRRSLGAGCTEPAVRVLAASSPASARSARSDQLVDAVSCAARQGVSTGRTTLRVASSQRAVSKHVRRAPNRLGRSRRQVAVLQQAAALDQVGIRELLGGRAIHVACERAGQRAHLHGQARVLPRARPAAARVLAAAAARQAGAPPRALGHRGPRRGASVRQHGCARRAHHTQGHVKHEQQKTQLRPCLSGSLAAYPNPCT